MKINDNSIIVQLDDFTKKAVAKNLVLEENAVISNDSLEILHSKVYDIEQDRLEALGFPTIFDGYLLVKMHGTPNSSNFWLETFFADSSTKDMECTQVGSILKIWHSHYLLSREMFEICEAIKVANSTQDEFLRWRAIELAKKSQSDKINFEGLSDNNIIVSVEKIKIDIKPNEDGSLDILPMFGSLSDKARTNYLNRMGDDSRDGLLVTDIVDGKYYRYNLNKKSLGAAKRVIDAKKIAKENAEKFIKNPQAFLLRDDEIAEDIGFDFESNYRVIGIGEPYMGYFGRLQYDSVFTKMYHLDEISEHVQGFEEKIDEMLDGKTQEELKNAFQEIQKNSSGYLEIFGVKFFGTLQMEILKSRIVGLLDSECTEEGNIKKVVLQISPNDYKTPNELLIEARKPLCEISTNDNNPKDLFDNVLPPKASYQIEGVNWLVDLYQNNYGGGLLADDMGLGKTYQLIAFMDYVLRKNTDKRVLIVAPKVLIENWSREIHKFVIDKSNIRVKIVRGSTLSSLRRGATTEKGVLNDFDAQAFLQLSDNPNILITTYETLTNYQFAFVKPVWNFELLILDEVHRIKNPLSLASQAVRAISGGIKFKALLTGTPVENELKDLWTLFDVFDSSHFGHLRRFAQEFMTATIDHDRLRDKASNYILRRSKKDYLSDLPPRFEIVKDIEMESDEERIFRDFLSSSLHPLKLLLLARKFSLHKALVEKTSYSSIENFLSCFSKTRQLVEILEQIKDKNEKVIIFVTVRLAQDLLRESLEDYFGVSIGIINGDNNSQDKLTQTLNDFKNKAGFGIIILSTLAAGVGLTITEANHVIHYERWWNASKEDQASDRVYRIGQEKEVFVYYINLVSKKMTTFDRALHELIQKKREMSGFLKPVGDISDQEMLDRLGFK